MLGPTSYFSFLQRLTNEPNKVSTVCLEKDNINISSQPCIVLSKAFYLGLGNTEQ